MDFNEDKSMSIFNVRSILINPNPLVLNEFWSNQVDFDWSSKYPILDFSTQFCPISVSILIWYIQFLKAKLILMRF